MDIADGTITCEQTGGLHNTQPTIQGGK